MATAEDLGTFTFAVSGTTAAIQNRYYLYGILVLAFVTASGGRRSVICWLEICP
ncbi:TRIC cation channel family protein [Fodinibius sediminis]|uniref:TRIC cation channel family protein n=1 Tax=Fodinibius sediminis TaxID=1214077 RepID=UPI003313BA5F